MKRSAFILLGLLITTLALLAACGGAAAEPTPTSIPAPKISTVPTVRAPSAAESLSSEQKSKRARPHISTVGDELRFDRARLQETAIFSVRVTFTNGSTVNQHNRVLLKPGADKDEVAAAGAQAGPENSYIPPGDDRIIAHTGLLGPGESEEVQFKGPIAGIYQFVCTFPGHSATMFGEFKFLQSGQR